MLRLLSLELEAGGLTPLDLHREGKGGPKDSPKTFQRHCQPGEDLKVALHEFHAWKGCLLQEGMGGFQLIEACRIDKDSQSSF